jgi:hypothetical protein
MVGRERGHIARNQAFPLGLLQRTAKHGANDVESVSATGSTLPNQALSH